MTITREQEKRILENPGTHKLVYEVLGLAKDRDCVDAWVDVLTAAEILEGRMERALR